MNALARTSGIAFLVLWPGVALAICGIEAGPVAGLFQVGLGDRPAAGFSLCTSLANHSTDNLSPDEALLFDGETTRLDLGWHWYGERWNAGMKVPYVSHDDGFLDPLIEGWHDWFGLPNGNRDRRPDDALFMQWNRAGQPVFTLDSAASGVGDVTFSVGRRIAGYGDWSLGLALAVKLPTGDADKLTGSGATDATLGLTYNNERLGGSERWQLSAAAAVTALGNADIAMLDNERNVAAGHVALRWQTGKRWGLGARLRARGALVTSNLREIGNSAAGLDAWLSIRAGAELEWTLGISEDIRVDSQPDVIFRLGLRRITATNR